MNHCYRICALIHRYRIILCVSNPLIDNLHIINVADCFSSVNLQSGLHLQTLPVLQYVLFVALFAITSLPDQLAAIFAFLVSIIYPIYIITPRTKSYLIKNRYA